MAKSYEEKIQNIDEKMAQLKQQKKALIAKEKEKERKARTRRLIQKGALVEKYLPGLEEDRLAHALELTRLFLLAERKEGTELTAENLSYLAAMLHANIPASGELEACKPLKQSFPCTDKKIDWKGYIKFLDHNKRIAYN